MNRKQRRALPHGQPAASAAAELFQQAAWHQDNGRLDDAARLYKRVTAREPGHGLAHNNLACVYLAQGRLRDASASFAQAIEATPELLHDITGILGTLRTVLPGFASAMQRAAAAWPRRIGFAEAFGDDIAAVAADPLLLTVLRSAVIGDRDAERLLTGLRADALAGAVTPLELSLGRAGAAVLHQRIRIRRDRGRTPPRPPRWRSASSRRCATPLRSPRRR